MQLQDILNAKGTAVYTIGPQASLEEVVHTLVRHNCGSLVVSGSEGPGRGPLGIVTERDILHLHKYGSELGRMRIAEVMTRDMIVGTTGDSVEDTMGLMTRHRVRHLPIVDGNRLVGIISIGDVVKAQHDSLTMENHYLKAYIHS